MLFTGVSMQAQTAKPAKKCTDDCCKDSKSSPKISSSNKSASMTGTANTSKVIACKLTSPEMQKRKAEVIASLKGKILSRQTLDNGYKYEFIGTDGNLDEIMTFIKTERLCCDFFTFNLSVADNKSNILLMITGPEGAKEFIKTELDL